jgi:hypothetical protein
MKRDTLSTLDLNERPGQRVWHIRRVRYYQTDGALELRPDERIFAAGPHHDYYSVMVESVTTAGSALRGGAGP